MNKKIMLFAILSIVIIASVSAEVISVVQEDLTSGYPDNLIVVVYNSGGSKLNNVQISGYMPYQNEFTRSRAATVNQRSSSKFYLEVDLQKTQPDYYPVILNYHDSDNNQKTVHSWIYIN